MFKTLIVEDNAIYRKTIRELLHSRYPTMCFEEAENGAQLSRIMESFIPDLVLMDIKLPGENGLELTRKIKRTHPRTLVIILTSYDLPEYRKVASSCGASYFVSKGSTSVEEILTSIDTILMNRGTTPPKNGLPLNCH